MNTQESFRSHRWAVLAAAAFACLMVQATGLALAPLLPQISVGLRVDLGAASNYVSTTFLLSGSLMGAILGGYFCDRFGVLAALVTGLALATLLGGVLGPSLTGCFWTGYFTATPGRPCFWVAR